MDERLFINQYLSILCHPFCADVHFLTGGIVEEFNLGLAILVCLDVRVPIDGATEVCHRRNHIVVLHLEGRGSVEALEVAFSQSLLAFGRIDEVVIDTYI